MYEMERTGKVPMRKEAFLGDAWLGFRGLFGQLSDDEYRKLHQAGHPLGYVYAPKAVSGAMSSKAPVPKAAIPKTAKPPIKTASAYDIGFSVGLKLAGVTPNPDPSQVGLPQQAPDFGRERATNKYQADLGKAKNKYVSDIRNQEIQQRVKDRENELKAQEDQLKRQQEIAKQTADLQQNMQQAFSSQPGGVPGLKLPQAQPGMAGPAGQGQPGQVRPMQ